MLTPQQRSSVNKRRADKMEQVVRNRLVAMEVRRCQLVTDVWVPKRKVGNSEWVCKKGGQKLDGDIRGIIHGASLICECKLTEGKTLAYSCFQRHQHAALAEYVQLGHVALIAWCSLYSGETYIVPYDPKFWKPRMSMSVDQAAKLQITNRSQLYELVPGPL